VGALYVQMLQVSDSVAAMPMTTPVRIWAMKREAERNRVAELAEQEKNCAKRSAEPGAPEPPASAAVPAVSERPANGSRRTLQGDVETGKHRQDDRGTLSGTQEARGTAQRAVHQDGGSGPNRVSQHQDRAARQVDQPVLGHQEPDSDLDCSASDDRTSARDRLRAAGLDRPATRFS